MGTCSLHCTVIDLFMCLLLIGTLVASSPNYFQATLQSFSHLKVKTSRRVSKSRSNWVLYGSRVLRSLAEGNGEHTVELTTIIVLIHFP